MMLKPRARHEQQNQNDNEPLFRVGEEEKIQEMFHGRA